jgi:hypothetical protein
VIIDHMMYHRDTIIILDSKRKLLPIITGLSRDSFQFLRSLEAFICNKKQQAATDGNDW